MLGYNHQEPRLKPRQRMTDQIRGLYDQRIQARKRKDFVESDRLAKAMEDLGFDPWNEDRWRGGALRRCRDTDDPPALRDTGFDDPPTLR